jgi:hypothetical protein
LKKWGEISKEEEIELFGMQKRERTMKKSGNQGTRKELEELRKYPKELYFFKINLQIF